MGSVHPDLLIGHPVDDAVVSWVHVPQVVGDGDDGERQSDHQPQHDVEDDGVVKVVFVGQVVGTARVTLQKPARVRKTDHEGVWVCSVDACLTVSPTQTYDGFGLQDRAGLPGQRSLKGFHRHDLHHSTVGVESVDVLCKLKINKRGEVKADKEVKIRKAAVDKRKPTFCRTEAKMVEASTYCGESLP